MFGVNFYDFSRVFGQFYLKKLKKMQKKISKKSPKKFFFPFFGLFEENIESQNCRREGGVWARTLYNLGPKIVENFQSQNVTQIMSSMAQELQKNIF